MGELLPDKEEKVVSQRWNHESRCSLTSSSSLSLTSARLGGGAIDKFKVHAKLRKVQVSLILTSPFPEVSSSHSPSKTWAAEVS